MSGEFWPKLRSVFRGSAQAVPNETTSKVPRKRSDNKVCGITRPPDEDCDEPHKITEHSESLQFLPAQQPVSRLRDPRSHRGNSYISSESARTFCTTSTSRHLPNPHVTHHDARSRSQPIPSSPPHKSILPTSCAHAGSTPPFCHTPVQPKTPNHHHYPPSLAQYSLQIDTDVHFNTAIHSSHSMILQPVLTAPGIGGPFIPRQDAHAAEPDPLRRKMSKLIKRRSALPHVPTSPKSYHEKAVSSIHSSEDICGRGHLPLVRPPSPLRLDIPTHQPWHNRRTNFELTPKSDHRNRASAAPPLAAQKTNPSTEALASLAWIGTSPMISTPCVSSYYINSVVPANQEINISMAVDENLPDEVVVERLEIIRKQSTRKDKHIPKTTSHGIGDIPLPSKRRFSLPEFRLRDYSARGVGSACQSDESEPVHQSLPASAILDDAEPDPDDAVWRTARKALLCIREIVRTERKYLEALKALLAGQTANPPPPLMLSYLPDLIQVSEALLKAFLDDPSAWGVSTAFMACEDDIEIAMVAWSGVAGNFFTDSPGKEAESPSIGEKWRRRKSLLLSATGYPLPPVAGKPNGNSPSASSSALPPLLSLMNEAGSRIREGQRTDEQLWKVSNNGRVDAFAERSRSRVNSVDEKDGRADDSKRGLPTRRHSVRDLAIQPTQRVMRYVLLYQDLLENTPPTSPSRALVERALEAATHIASKCDSAQSNTAFLR